MNTCQVDECGRKVFGHGFCNMHYKRWKKTGDPGPSQTLRRDACSVDGCPEPHCGLGLCNTHLTRFKASGEVPTTPIRRYGEAKPKCSRLLCDQDARTMGLCGKHYSRQQSWRSNIGSDMTWEVYDALWEEQDGKCGICETDMIWDSRFTHVDHDHETGKVRGLICGPCNQGLGSLGDSIERLQKAITYLTSSS